MGKEYFEKCHTLARLVKGSCSWTALYYGLRAHPRCWIGFLKARVIEIIQVMLGSCRKTWIKRRVINEAKSFAKEHAELVVGDVIKPLAMYLPQYHAFPENDKWWGKGFTEWSNVRRATPLFEGHYQPHVPHPDIGYYDLHDVDIMRRQAAMAKKYGIYGFCFYYYSFANGKRLLEMPLNNWLNAKDIDFPFCYAWANENWTRAWDGGDREIIMPQDYNMENMSNMMKRMLVDFRDPRYIKIGDKNNTPILLVYRPEIIPDITRVVDVWRQMARAFGFDDLHLVSMQNFSDLDPRKMAMDAACEFASFKVGPRLWAKCSVPFKRLFHNEMPLQAVPYESVMGKVDHCKDLGYPLYKAVVPNWDNTPRRAENGTMVVGGTPCKFKKMLKSAIVQTIGSKKIRDNGFLFINAWNEWGEGAHLEPDVRNGYAYLEQIHSLMKSSLQTMLRNESCAGYRKADMKNV